MTHTTQTRISVGLSFFLMIGLATNAKAQCDESSYCDATRWSSPTAWSFGAKALFLDRVDDNQTLFSGANGNFESDEFGLGFQGGYELDARYHLDNCTALTTRWMSVDRWRDDHRGLAGAPGNAILNAAAPFTFLNVDSVDGIHRSTLHSLELGISRRLTNDLRFTTGFRYLEIDDQIHFALPAGAALTTLGTTTQNRLYGGQIGLESVLLKQDAWSVDGFAKIGVFGNAAKHASFVDTGGGTLSTRGGTSKGSFLGELGCNVRRSLTEHLDFIAGYQVMWITTVAVASDELVASNVLVPESIQAADSVFYHGATVGLDFRY